MKTKKDYIDSMTTLWVDREDMKWLVKYQNKLKKRGAGSIVTSLINLVKEHKMENELK